MTTENLAAGERQHAECIAEHEAAKAKQATIDIIDGTAEREATP